MAGLAFHFERFGNRGFADAKFAVGFTQTHPVQIIDFAQGQKAASGFKADVVPFLPNPSTVLEPAAAVAPREDGKWGALLGYQRTDDWSPETGYKRSIVVGDRDKFSIGPEEIMAEPAAHFGWDGVGYIYVNVASVTPGFPGPDDAHSFRRYSADGTLLTDWQPFGLLVGGFTGFHTHAGTGITWAWMQANYNVRVVARDREGKLLPGMQPSGYLELEGHKVLGPGGAYAPVLIPGPNGALVVSEEGPQRGKLWAQAIGLDGLPVSDGFLLQMPDCDGYLAEVNEVSGTAIGDDYMVVAHDGSPTQVFRTTSTSMVSRRRVLDHLGTYCECDLVCDPRIPPRAVGARFFAAYEWQGSPWILFEDGTDGTLNETMRFFREDGACMLETFYSAALRAGKGWAAP